jgi:hypothetical protein
MHGPRRNCSRERLAATLFDIRSTIRKVNRFLRFGNPKANFYAL